ncbi:MAG: hypothetical protein EPN43_05565 [Jatrophihabitans sp.]|nr:MAG: hypothetical protein EPN43_05565 [Jatrophihabitans sp.]
MTTAAAALQSVAGLGWTAIACIVVVCVLNYLGAAVATQAAAGVRLPLGELVASQVASSAANLLTPAGVGGAALTGRYLTRRGRLRPAEATAAVSALAALGGIADLLAFVVIIGLALLLGLPGAAAELPELTERLANMAPVPQGWWQWILVALAAGAVPAAVLIVRRRRVAGRAARAWNSFVSSLRDLAHRPGRVATLLTASAATTVLFAAGFAAAAVLGPAHLPGADFAALMIGYMIAAAAANAVPTPGGIGSADAAFVGVLVAAHVPLAPALATVLAFRVGTLWAPAAAGLFLTGTLKRRQAI